MLLSEFHKFVTWSFFDITFVLYIEFLEILKSQNFLLDSILYLMFQFSPKKSTISCHGTSGDHVLHYFIYLFFANIIMTLETENFTEIVALALTL